LKSGIIIILSKYARYIISNKWIQSPLPTNKNKILNPRHHDEAKDPKPKESLLYNNSIYRRHPQIK
jgi:hypothetical protein